MATTNAGNGQSRDGKPRFKSDRPQGGQKDFKNRDYKKDFNKGDKDHKSDFKGRGENRGKGEFKGRPDFKSNKGGFKGSFDKGGFAKDKDEDDKPVRRAKQTKADTKPKEQQPDKFEIINRLEKEKKAVKKKQSEAKKENRQQKHQARPKRSGNVDWTREYENGSYDDDDLDMFY